MISVPLVIMRFPRPPMAGARSHRVDWHAPSSQPIRPFPTVEFCLAATQEIDHHAQGVQIRHNARQHPAAFFVTHQERQRGHVILGSPPLLPTSRARCPDSPSSHPSELIPTGPFLPHALISGRHPRLLQPDSLEMRMGPLPPA
jgi:hypothetical protein